MGKFVGGRIITLECKDIPCLIDFYKQFGFINIKKDYENDELLQQFMKILKEDDLIEKNNNE